MRPSTSRIQVVGNGKINEGKKRKARKVASTLDYISSPTKNWQKKGLVEKMQVRKG